MKQSKIHGIDRFVLVSSRLLKTIWLFFFLVLTSIAIYLVINSLAQYYKYEVKTCIREVFQSNIQFPTVTVCNVNPMVTPAAKTYIQNKLKSKFNVLVSDYQELTSYIKSGLIPENELSYLLYSLNKDSIDKNTKRSFGYEPLECSYLGTPCSFDHDLDWYFDSDFGNCFKFNPSQFKNGTRREVYQIGMPFSGLEMTMFLGVPDDRKAYF